ncbi:MAG: 2'-5' RNA ligase family protein [Clostridiaceae bacterium]|nr:2'-5' RNA ligase family protein [Clostridiaceae bacterium]
MKYYLVALFDKQSYSYIEEMQKSICKKYKIYKNMPVLHITLEVIGDPDIEKLNKIVSDILKPYKKFKVEINGAMCFDPPYKWDLHVSLANTNYAIREWSSKEYVAACDTAKKENIHKMAKIDRIELWKPINNKKEMIIKSFPLRDF